MGNEHCGKHFYRSLAYLFLIFICRLRHLAYSTNCSHRPLPQALRRRRMCVLTRIVGPRPISRLLTKPRHLSPAELNLRPRTLFSVLNQICYAFCPCPWNCLLLSKRVTIHLHQLYKHRLNQIILPYCNTGYWGCNNHSASYRDIRPCFFGNLVTGRSPTKWLIYRKR